MSNSLGRQILSDLVHYRSYAAVKADGKKETRQEVIDRVKIMHQTKFPWFESQIEEVFEQVHAARVVPSMRSMQFGGMPIFRSNARLFNCAYAALQEWRDFSDLFWLLMNGTGVGYSVQRPHVEKLPVVSEGWAEFYDIPDTKEGWADAVRKTLENPKLEVGLSQLRPKGASLSTGGQSSGPESIADLLVQIKTILASAAGRQLKPIEAFDIMCHIADVVVVGNVRRAATIALFSVDDEEMLTAKSGDWYFDNSQRMRANISAALYRDDPEFETNMRIVMRRCFDSHSGEPGVWLTNSSEYGANPCKPLRAVILTDKGYITYEQALKLDGLTIISADGRPLKASKPFKTGEQKEVMRVHLSNGMFLDGTPNHQHMLSDHKWEELGNLKVGDRLLYAYPQVMHTDVAEDDRYLQGVLAGWTHGDGWLYRRKDSGGVRHGMCLDQQEFDLIPFFEENFNVKFSPHYQKPETCKVAHFKADIYKPLLEDGYDLDKNNLKWIYGKDNNFKLGFLRALFTADGSVRTDGRVELYSARRPALEVVSNILREFGIRNIITRHAKAKVWRKGDQQRHNCDQWKISITGGEFLDIGFLSEAKQSILQSQGKREWSKFKGGLNKEYVRVVDIQREYSCEDVYDITVYDDTHAYLDSGVITHNCLEISLRHRGLCNLTEVNVAACTSADDLFDAVASATAIGTLQASYTEFEFIHPDWKKNAQEEALLGVSLTGQAQSWDLLSQENLRSAADLARAVNIAWAEKLEINTAARITTTKPSGNTSAWFGTTSGIHAAHSEYILRRVRVDRKDPLGKHLIEMHGENLPNSGEFIETDKFNSENIVVSIPISYQGAIVRKHESAIALMNRAKHIHNNWIKPGHNVGPNTHNVSLTVSYLSAEEDSIIQWMLDNRETYAGMSFLPEDGGIYEQMPFEELTREQHDMWLYKTPKDIDFGSLEFVDYIDARISELACSGGSCEVV